MFSVEDLSGGIRVDDLLGLVDDTIELVLAAGLCLFPEAALLVGREHNDCLTMVGEVLEHDVSRRLDGALAHDRASELEVDALEPDVVTVRKFDVVRPAQARFQMVRAHAPGELVESPIVVGLVLRVQVEVGYWWVVRGVLTKHLGAVGELGLQSLAENGVEGLELARAYVQAAHRKGDDLLQPLEVVLRLRGRSQVLRCEGPEVDNALDGGAGLEDFDWQGDVSNSKSLQESHCELFHHIDQHALLARHRLFVCTHQATKRWLHEAP